MANSWGSAIERGGVSNSWELGGGYFAEDFRFKNKDAGEGPKQLFSACTRTRTHDAMRYGDDTRTRTRLRRTRLRPRSRLRLKCGPHFGALDNGLPTAYGLCKAARRCPIINAHFLWFNSTIFCNFSYSWFRNSLCFSQLLVALVLGVFGFFALAKIAAGWNKYRNRCVGRTFSTETAKASASQSQTEQNLWWEETGSRERSLPLAEKKLHNESENRVKNERRRAGVSGNERRALGESDCAYEEAAKAKNRSKT